MSPLDRILPFLAEIGLVVREASLPADTFLPGICIEAGELIFDRSRLAHPGDLLHEAGHIAVMPPSRRPGLSGDLKSDPGEEMAAIAWSWAACMHLQLAPEILFHEAGYKGAARSMIENFSSGRTFGVPLLQWYGLTRERPDPLVPDQPVYPKMGRWLRPEPEPDPLPAN